MKHWPAFAALLMRSTIFALLAASALTASCGGGGGGSAANNPPMELSAYEMLVAELGDSFVSQYPDPVLDEFSQYSDPQAYAGLGWHLYREAGFGALSGLGDVSAWEGASTGGTDGRLTGTARVTINGVDAQNTRVAFSQVVALDGTAHDIPDLMFSLLPYLEDRTGSRRSENAGAGARISIDLGPRVAGVREVEFNGEFWRHGESGTHSGYSGSFSGDTGVDDSQF